MLIERIICNIKERREQVVNGGINCIPLPFKRFRNELPGIEQKRLYLVSGASKSGKSQFGSYMFLYTPILYAYNNPDKIRVKVFYFPLEETQEQVTMRFMSFLLYVLSNKTIRISPVDLMSTRSDRPLDPYVIALLESEKYQNILKFFEEHVYFCSEKNPTGIFKQMDSYAKSNGTIHKKKQVINDRANNTMTEQLVFDYYEPNDKNEYVIGITDHVSLLSLESGQTLKQAIDTHANYNMLLRNRYNYILVDMQQQNIKNLNFSEQKLAYIKNFCNFAALNNTVKITNK